jgi:hypothetical protein
MASRFMTASVDDSATGVLAITEASSERDGRGSWFHSHAKQPPHEAALTILCSPCAMSRTSMLARPSLPAADPTSRNKFQFRA